MKSKPFEEKIHEGDLCPPLDSDYGDLATPKRDGCEDTTVKKTKGMSAMPYMEGMLVQ